MKKSGLGYHLLAFVVVALWGVTFISTKILIVAGLSPAQIFAMRFSVAYIGIWILCVGKAQARRAFCGSFKDEAAFLFLGVTGGSAYFLTENTALAYTQACNVSFIVCSAPLLTALLTMLVKHFFHGSLSDSLENLGAHKGLLAGSLLALGGMAMVLFDGNAVEFSAKGDILALGAAMCWALYSVVLGHMATAYGTLFATRKVFFYGLVTIIPFIASNLPELSILAKTEVWGNLAFLSVVASLACFVLWNKVLTGLGNVTATNYVYLNPLFTLVAAVAVLGESLTLQSTLGCGAILAGVIIGGIKRVSYS